jgi:hypothetical protein
MTAAVKKERRQHPRKICALSTFERIPEPQSGFYVTDISMGGAFIRTDAPLRIGQKLNLAIDVLNVEEPFRVDCRVVAKKPGGYGVAFEGLTGRQKELLGFLWW